MQKYNREEFEEVIVDIGRVTKVVKGGRRFRFTALVVVGNRNGLVGFGYGKAKEVPDAIRKAVDDAFKNIISVKLKGSTIPHDIEVKYNASRILLRPASEGTGVIAGGGAGGVWKMNGCGGGGFNTHFCPGDGEFCTEVQETEHGDPKSDGPLLFRQAVAPQPGSEFSPRKELPGCEFVPAFDGRQEEKRRLC